jgi:hypothetical protein
MKVESQFEPTEVQSRQLRRHIERQRLDQMDRAQSDDEREWLKKWDGLTPNPFEYDRNRNRGRSSLIGLLPFHKVFKCVHCGKEVDTLDTITHEGCTHL